MVPGCVPGLAPPGFGPALLPARAPPTSSPGPPLQPLGKEQDERRSSPGTGDLHRAQILGHRGRAWPLGPPAQLPQRTWPRLRPTGWWWRRDIMDSACPDFRGPQPLSMNPWIPRSYAGAPPALCRSCRGASGVPPIRASKRPHSPPGSDHGGTLSQKHLLSK